MFKKFKKILVFVLIFLLLISNITTFLCEQKAYAALETTIVIGGSEVVSAIISTLSGASVSSNLTDEQKLALYDQNKLSYYETLQFIVEHPDITVDLLEADQREKFLSACATLNHTASSVDEMNKYIHGSVAEKMENFRDQFSVYSNNENPNDDDNNKFKNMLKRASALGGALGIAASGILSVVYGININNDNSDIICDGVSTDIHIMGSWTIVNVASIYDGYYWLIDHTVETNGNLSAGYFVSNNTVLVFTYNSDKKTINGIPNFLTGKYPFYSHSGNFKGDVYLGNSSSWKSGGYVIDNGWNVKCNIPVFNTYADMQSYFKGDISVEDAVNYDDGTIKIPDNLDDVQKVDAQKWADVKNLIDLNPDKEEDVRGFIGIYADSVADLSKQGQGKEPSTDDINEAAKRAIEKRLEPEYEPDIEPEPTPQPTTAPEPTPQPTTQPEPTPQPTTQPEPTPQPTTQPEPTPQPTVTPIPTPTPEPSEQDGHLGGIVGDVFPFCIPFDLIYLVKSLKAEPAPPKWVIPFRYERLGIDEAIVIDFAQFEPIAKVCRVCFTILFILMLIMVSRKLIKG